MLATVINYLLEITLGALIPSCFCLRSLGVPLRFFLRRPLFAVSLHFRYSYSGC